MGTHIKPENKELTTKGETLVAIKAAQFDKAGLTKTNIELIKGNSGPTPFATLTNFTNAAHCPFKPAPHGQIAFRKLNIIDKFGQAIVALDPQPQPHNNPPPPLFPCISDFYEPHTVHDNNHKRVANTVQPPKADSCEFIQLPPQINQPARLNAAFIIPADASDRKISYWRPTTEWENPIWGWIVVNYADYGIQLFQEDGTFYGEVRIGGPNGALIAPKWSPFEPKSDTGPRTAKLDALIQRLGNEDYLKGVWAMLTSALDSLPPAPDAYAQFLGCTIGKPLALVDMGWSLELAGPALKNQSTLTGIHSSFPERALLIDDDDDTDVVGDKSYTFHVKLGDANREYDGLVGYFDGYPTPVDGEDLDYKTINTYFTGAATDPAFKNLRRLNKDTYPAFKPYWVSPVDNSSKTVNAAEFSARHNKALRPFGAILDPFTAVHGYSSFLPAKALQLPPWRWQNAMENLVAFFRVGPITLTSDIEKYAPDEGLSIEKTKARPGRNVPVPGLGTGEEWNWLQPYNVQDDGKPLYNAFGIEGKGNLGTPGFQKAPYTAVEGFLQLRRPVIQGEGEAEGGNK